MKLIFTYIIALEILGCVYMQSIPAAIEHTVELIELGKSKIQITENDKVVILLGNSKSGVSTVAQILAGNNSQLQIYLNDYGELAIKDEDGLIAQGTTANTIFPSTIKNAKGEIYVDLPAVDAEVAERIVIGKAHTNLVTSTLTNYVLNSVRSVKIGIVADSFSILPKQLFKLLLNVKQLITSQTPYSPSIFLIVNKVDPTADFNDIISNVKTSFAKCREYSWEGWENTEEDDYYIRNLTYSLRDRIVLMTYPSDNNLSVVADDDVIQQLKSKALFFINSLSFVQKYSYKTGFIQTESSVSILQNYINEINDNITQIIQTFPPLVQEYYDKNSKNIEDIKTVRNATKLQLENLQFIRKNKKIDNVDDLNLLLTNNEISKLIPIQSFISLNNLATLATNIKEISGYQITFSLQNWWVTLEEMIDISNKVYTWYDFILSFYDVMSDFEVQTNKQRFNVKNLTDWGQTTKPQGLVVTSENFTQFLATVIPYFYGSDTPYNILLNSKPDEVKLYFINDIVNRTLKAKPFVIKSTDTNLIVQRDSMNTCDMYELDYNYDVVIMSLKSIIIDCPFPDVTPKISVLGQRWISDCKHNTPFLDQEKAHPFKLSAFPENQFPPIAINQFKEYLSTYLYDPLVRSDVIEQLRNLNNPQLASPFALLDYFDEYSALILKYSSLTKKEEALFFYKLFEEKLVNNLEHIITDDASRKAAAQLLTSVKTKISTIQLESGGLVIDMNGYLDLAIASVQELKLVIDEQDNDKIKEHQKEIRDEYRDEITKKVEEAHTLLDTVLYPKLDESFAQINNTAVELLNDTRKLIEEGQRVEEELQATRKKLKRKLRWQMFWDCMLFGVRLALDVFNMSNPITDALTNGVEHAVEVNGEPLPSLPLPPGVIEGQKVVMDTWLKQRNLTADFLSQVYDDVKEELDDENIKVDVETVINDLYDGRANDKSVQDLLRVIIDVVDEKLKEQSLTRASRESLELLQGGVYIAGLPGLGNVINAASENSKVLPRRVSKKDLRACEQEILKTRLQVEALFLYLSEVEYYLIPMLQNMEQNLHDVENNLANKSLAVLDIAAWGVQKSLKDMSRSITKFTDGFSEEEDFANEIEDVNDIMLTIIGIFDRIQEWQEQERLANYMYNLICPDADEIVITNATLKTAVDKMNMDMKMSLVLLHYNQAVRAFKQWVLPFADPYMFELDFNISPEPPLFIEKVSNTLVSLKSKVSNYYTRIDDYDKYIATGIFDYDHVSSKPFVTFSKEEYNNEITSLLAGREIGVSSIKGLKNFVTRHALKFNDLRINFTLTEKNETLNLQFQNLLKYFSVSMTQTGNNYFDYNDVTYYVINDQLEFDYSLERDEYGLPINFNNVFGKVLSGDLMLSPFSFWKLRLYVDESKLARQDVPTFNDLLKFKDLVDLNFIGKGSYIKAVNGQLPNLNMDQYYMHLEN